MDGKREGGGEEREEGEEGLEIKLRVCEGGRKGDREREL